MDMTPSMHRFIARGRGPREAREGEGIYQDDAQIAPRQNGKD